MEKNFKKHDIEEVIDSNNNLVGTDDEPSTGANKETEAGGTTDKNARIAHQNYKNDFLGRFGFYFYESEEDNKNVEDNLARKLYEKYLEVLNHYHENPDDLEKDWKLHQRVDFETQPEGSREHDYEWASDILKMLEPHMKKDINEANVVEDKLTTKKKSNDIVKKEKKDLTDKKLDKVADLLAQLPKNDLDKLMNLLEEKKKK